MLEVKKRIQSFVIDEGGAVTVDWVVLAAAVAFLSIPVLTAVTTSVQGGADTIATDVEAAADQ